MREPKTQTCAQLKTLAMIVTSMLNFKFSVLAVEWSRYINRKPTINLVHYSPHKPKSMLQWISHNACKTEECTFVESSTIRKKPPENAQCSSHTHQSVLYKILHLNSFWRQSTRVNKAAVPIQLQAWPNAHQRNPNSRVFKTNYSINPISCSNKEYQRCKTNQRVKQTCFLFNMKHQITWWADVWIFWELVQLW